MKKILLLSSSIGLSTLLFTGCTLPFGKYLEASNIKGTNAEEYSKKYGFIGGYNKLVEDIEKENELKNINNFDEEKQLNLIRNNAFLIERINKEYDKYLMEYDFRTRKERKLEYQKKLSELNKLYGK